MGDPVLHVVAGPNGAGKSTFIERVLPLRLEVVSADFIAAQRWPGAESLHAYEAAAFAQERRFELISLRRSFVVETVFSHESKIDLVHQACASGYITAIHAVLVPEEVAVVRVLRRAENGGHSVPEEKVRTRFQRLWGYLAVAVAVSSEAHIYDNSSVHSPFRRVASFRNGNPVGDICWPDWAPSALRRISA